MNVFLSVEDTERLHHEVFTVKISYLFNDLGDVCRLLSFIAMEFCHRRKSSCDSEESLSICFRSTGRAWALAQSVLSIHPVASRPCRDFWMLGLSSKSAKSCGKLLLLLSQVQRKARSND